VTNQLETIPLNPKLFVCYIITEVQFNGSYNLLYLFIRWLCGILGNAAATATGSNWPSTQISREANHMEK